jgi:hypothetical protein
VGQQNSKGPIALHPDCRGYACSHVGRRCNPRKLVAGQQQRLSAYSDILPPSTKIGEAEVRENASESAYIARPEIVIAENEKHSNLGTKSAERIGEPGETCRMVNQITGYRNQIRFPGIGAVHNFMKILRRNSARKMEVGQMYDGKAIKRAWKSAKFHLSPLDRQPKRLVTGHK